jgi:adenylylsulfate kinase-like enzyme
MIYLITGKANAGKSYYAQKLKEELISLNRKVSLIDGDIWRKLNNNQDFSEKGRFTNLISAAQYAMKQILENKYDDCILSFIAPTKFLRETMRSFWIVENYLIYIPGGKLWENTIYEMPSIDELGVRNPKLEIS